LNTIMTNSAMQGWFDCQIQPRSTSSRGRLPWGCTPRNSAGFFFVLQPEPMQLWLTTASFTLSGLGRGEGELVGNGKKHWRSAVLCLHDIRKMKMKWNENFRVPDINPTSCRVYDLLAKTRNLIQHRDSKEHSFNNLPASPPVGRQPNFQCHTALIWLSLHLDCSQMSLPTSYLTNSPIDA
jgi:hypothetical protein